MGKKLEDVPILVTEAIAIREALRVAGDYKIENVMMESDTELVNNFIQRRIQAPS